MWEFEGEHSVNIKLYVYFFFCNKCKYSFYLAKEIKYIVSPFTKEIILEGQKYLILFKRLLSITLRIFCSNFQDLSNKNSHHTSLKIDWFPIQKMFCNLQIVY